MFTFRTIPGLMERQLLKVVVFLSGNEAEEFFDCIRRLRWFFLSGLIHKDTNSTRHGGWMFTRSKFLICICAQISLFWSYDGQAGGKNAVIKINLSTSLLKEGLQRPEWPTAQTASGSSQLWRADVCPVHLQTNQQNTLSRKNSCITNLATSVLWLIAAYRSPAGYSFDYFFSTNNPIFCRTLSPFIVVLNIKSYHRCTKITFFKKRFGGGGGGSGQKMKPYERP